ncbi:MAG TPA: hypothetical protein VFM45_03525 [Anaeromyxobacteraceae bacterium]|nr:hypothetical protein [Anaeromyxobacteraceae bacterium]
MAAPTRLAAALALLLAAASAPAQESFEPAPAASPTTNALVPIRRSEPHSEFALVMGGASVDSPAVSGLGRGVLQLEGSWAPARTWELFATVNPVAYRWLQVRGQTSALLAFGSTTLGATWVPVALPQGRLVGGAFVRVLLPTSEELPGNHAWGGQAGFTARGVVLPWMAWFAGASLRVTQAWGTRIDETRGGASAAAGLAFVPAPWMRVMAQALCNAPFGGPPATIAPALAVRFVQGDFAADLGVTQTFGAQLRPIAAFARMSWRLDG